MSAKVVAFSVLLDNSNDISLFGTRNVVGVESKQESINNDPLLRSIRRIQQGLQEIESTQTYLRTRERNHRRTTESANTRVLVWTVAEIGVILGMGLTSVIYLRRMFKLKRVV
uniref:Transmembrane emp24 domain-containing protein A n=1 Tax=Lygus hesperus TaxID=30085 RepID=A0A0A9YVX1_LYGHE